MFGKRRLEVGVEFVSKLNPFQTGAVAAVMSACAFWTSGVPAKIPMFPSVIITADEAMSFFRKFRLVSM